MDTKLIFTLALSAVLTFTISQNAIAMEDESDTTSSMISLKNLETESWKKVIQTEVPIGRKQLEKYKEIYGNHVAQHGETPESLKKVVEGLDEPFFWLYKNAYERLTEFEKQNPHFKIELKEAPTEVLRGIFIKHYNELLNQNSTDFTHQHTLHLSVGAFEKKVMDVLRLLDFCFKGGDQSLLKNDLTEVSKEDNQLYSGTLPFSPVFLKKQGLSIESMNYAYFGTGPFLAACEVGPSLNAHSRLYSKSNYMFMRNHDLTHAHTTIKYLKQAKPRLFEVFQKLHAKMETLPVNGTARDLLQLGLFFSGHEYVHYLEKRSTDSGQLRDEIKFILDTMTENITLSLKGQETEMANRDHIVFYKDAMDGIQALVQKHFPVQFADAISLNVMSAQKEFNVQKTKPLIALSIFNQKFFDLTDDILFEVERGRSKQASDIIEYIL